MRIEVDSIIFDLEYAINLNIGKAKINSIRKACEFELTNNKLLTLEEKMKEYHIITLTYYREYKYKESIEFAEKVFESAKEIKNEYYLAKSYVWMALNSLFLSDITKFECYYNMAEKLFVNMEKYEDIALLTARALLCMCKRVYSKEVLNEYIEKALKYMEKFQSELSAQIYMIIGSSYSIGLNNFEVAIDTYSKALDIARQYNLIEMEAIILYYIGISYYKLDMALKAMKTFNYILNEKRFKDNIIFKAVAALDLISVHVDNKIDLEKVDKIIKNCEKFIVEVEDEKKEQYLVQLDLYKLKYYIAINKFNSLEAIDMLNNAKKVYDKYKTNFIFNQIDFGIQQLFGIAYLDLGEYDKAIESHKIALELSNNYPIKYKIESYENLSKVYEKIGDYKNALLYMKSANISRRDEEHKSLIKKYIVTQDNYERLRDNEKEKNNFFITLSHELKTPVNIVYSSLQLLNLFRYRSDRDFKDYYIKYEKSIKQNCLRMLRLINNIIDTTKINLGAIKPEFINYDIIELVEDITMSTLSSVEAKGIDIIFDTDIEEKVIKCDPNMIERIVLNLLSNAIKFSSSNGNILVSISNENNYVIIKVKDDGIGIPLKMKDKIFNQFEQVDKSLNKKTQGSGIGLPLVKLLVSLHSGYIEVDSEEGQGSEFRIYLPDCTKKEISENVISEKYDVLEERVNTELSDIYIT